MRLVDHKIFQPSPEAPLNFEASVEQSRQTLERLHGRRYAAAIDRLYTETWRLLEANWQSVVEIAAALLAEGTVSASRLDGIIMAQAAGHWRCV